MKKKVLLFSIIFCLIVAAISISVIASDEAIPELDFKTATVTITDSVYITMKVVSGGVDFSDVKLLVWDAPCEEYLLGTQKYTVSYSGESETVSGVERGIYKFKAMSAKMMTDEFYFVVYTNHDGVDYYSRVVKYSVLQYAYNTLAKDTTSEKLRNVLLDMLQYGADSQLYFSDYKTDRLPTDTWYQIKLTSGKLYDGTTSGLYLPGDKIELRAPEAHANGLPFAYWTDSTGKIVSRNRIFTVTVGEKNEQYTPQFGNPGFIFTSNGDGTCTITGVDLYTDSALTIPATAPNGETVVAIANSAFKNDTTFTSVIIPDSITSIGNDAFAGCTSIKSVYFVGYKKDFEAISFGTGNDVIKNADVQFSLSDGNDEDVDIVFPPHGWG